MTQAQQSEAQRLAAICETKGMFPVADELNRMHARILELEQGKCLHQIAEPAPTESVLIDGTDYVVHAEVAAELLRLHIELQTAQQAVQPAVPEGWVPCVITYEGQQPEEIAYGPQIMMDRLKKWLDRYFEMRTAPAHPAEGVPALASEWYGKLPERLQRALNALRLECPPAVADGVEFEVRSHYEAMHTSLSTSRRMYGAARVRLEAIDAAQPDPFAATQPAALVLAAREFPPMTPELASILGLMCFQCISFAQALRAAGHTIKTSAEDEQAAVLHWMLGHYFRHGDDWRTAAAEDMKRMEAAALAAQAKQGGAA